MRRVLATIPLVVLLVSGCYTVLRHPPVQDEEEISEPVAVRNECAACHSDWDMERFGYAFHPGWYPAYGAWLGWYWEPWWMDVVVAAPSHPRSGKQSMQGAGLVNDRNAPASSGVPAGVWLPPAAPLRPPTVLDTPVPPTSPRSSDPEPEAVPTDPDERRGSNPRAGAGRTGAPARNPADGSDGTGPAARPAEPATEPRKEPERREGRTEKNAKPAAKQGQGMTNDRKGPKP
jgi:hypothetical protein